MKIAIVFILIAFNLTFFVSCTPIGQRSSSQPKNGGATLQVTPDPSKSYGTADSGGGNTFLGKPLESYKINPRSLEAYKNNLKSWLESEKLKDHPIVHTLQSLLDKKIWYMIPGELKQLSSEKIGSAVGVELQQTALQDFKQIWVNSLIFDKMAPTEQSVLLIHELLMGLRLLKFDSALEECLVSSSKLDNENLQHCYNGHSDKIRGKPSDLSPNDYAQIRNATALISENAAKLTAEMLTEILGSQGFLEINPKREITLEQMGHMIETSKLIKSWPNYGYHIGRFFWENQGAILSGTNKSFTLDSDAKCDDVDITITHEKISVSMVEDGKSISFSHRWTSPIVLYLSKDIFTGVSFYGTGFNMLKSNGLSAKKGDVVVNLDLKFLTNTLMGIDLSKTICTDEDCSSSGQGIDGYRLLCYTRKSLQFTLGKE